MRLQRGSGDELGAGGLNPTQMAGTPCRDRNWLGSGGQLEA
jgi:hypothetical protein